MCMSKDSGPLSLCAYIESKEVQPIGLLLLTNYDNVYDFGIPIMWVETTSVETIVDCFLIYKPTQFNYVVHRSFLEIGAHVN